MNLPKNLYLTVSDLQEQFANPVEEQSNDDVLVEETAELNQIKKQFTKYRLINS